MSQGQIQAECASRGKRGLVRSAQRVVPVPAFLGRTTPVPVSSLVSNKANVPRYWPEKADQAKEQSQTNPIGARWGRTGSPGGPGVIMRAKQTQFRRFWPGNWGRSKKQSQFRRKMPNGSIGRRLCLPWRAGLGRLPRLK